MNDNSTVVVGDVYAQTPTDNPIPGCPVSEFDKLVVTKVTPSFVAYTCKTDSGDRELRGWETTREWEIFSRRLKRINITNI